MKNSGILLLVSLLACAGLTAIYLRGESHMAHDREAVSSMFENLRLMETSIQKDVLRSRNFMLGNYDSLVDNQDHLEKSCAQLLGHEPGLRLYGELSARLDTALERYCDQVTRTQDAVERFKSKNAIIRNSMFYMTKFVDAPGAKHSDSVAENLVRLTFQFSFVRGEESRAAVQRYLSKAKHKGEELHLLVAHSSAILREIESLDSLVKEIVSSENHEILGELEDVYLSEFAAAESRAILFRRVLFGLCLLFLAYTVYAAIKLLKSARALSAANSELEKRVEERTRALNDSLRLISEQQGQMVSSARMSALGEMAGQAAHEINTPLGALLLVADLIGRKIDAAEFDQAFYRKQMDMIVAITTKMGRIVSSMRKLASGTRDESMSVAGLRQLVEETLILCEGRFKRSSIVFESKLEIGDLATLQCYPSEVTQVLINLMNNAHDAVKSHPEKWVRLEVKETFDKTIFLVIDSGTGVPVELQEKIFEARFTTKSLDQGTGFGLSISRKIAERHGGKLMLDPSAENTTFVFEIPKSSEKDVLEIAS